MTDLTSTDPADPALRLIVTTDPAPIDGLNDPTGTQDAPPALRLIVPPTVPGATG
jgi:hypothetical protein